MFINFGFDGLDEQCEINVRLGDTIVQRQRMPLLFAKQQFFQLVQELTKDNRPMEVKCVRKVYSEEGKQIENSLSFQNNSYIKEFGEKENE